MKTTIIAISFAALVAAVPQRGYITKVVTTKTTSAKPVSTSCTRTICADYINSCGMLYGGCYPACTGLTTPVFTPPPCPTTTKTPTKTTTTTCRTICVDAVNECGIKYGGCYCSGSPPPYTKPPCPTTTAPTPTPVKCGGLAGFQCPKDQICIDDPKSPCGIAVDCLGICVTGEFCGGIAGFACSDKNDVCIDDPRDDCSPKTGGADCGGLCVPKAWVP
ncbi:hypothetical protein TWF694_007679 [Orbilia ellipsospora]|uniref:Uncharacterized protein n=1 Tax=Orbilia ellipsospora TaxID=2528407 RepID=A0AAV9XJY1_9PEZI